MKICPVCGKTVLWGGIKKGDQRYCSADCYMEDPANEGDPTWKKIKGSLVRRISNWIVYGFGGVMVLGMTCAFLYNNLIERTPWYKGPVIDRWLLITILLVIAFGILLLLGRRLIMGLMAFRFSQRAVKRLERINFSQTVKRLGFRSGILATSYRHEGKKIAFFDHGGCNLSIPGVKDYRYSCWGIDSVQNSVLKPGSAELAGIYDDHKTTVEDEDEADSIFYGFDGTKVCFHSGETEEMAHSETPFNTRAERIVVTGEHVIRARYRKRGRIELTDYRSEQPFGRIREFFLWGFAQFTQPVTLMEGLFIATLVTLSGEKANPYDDV